jgi:hypothetical protein
MFPLIIIDCAETISMDKTNILLFFFTANMFPC